MRGTYTHRPVLLEECIQGLAIRPDGLYIDGTLGRGGHSEEIVKRLTQGGRLICIDRDSQAFQQHLHQERRMSGRNYLREIGK